MIFRSKKSKQALTRFLVNKLKRKPERVARFLSISRATVYRYLQNNEKG